MRNRLVIIGLGLVLIVAVAALLVHKRGHRLAVNDPASGLYRQAMVLETQGELLAAKKDLQKLIEESPNFKQICEAQKKLEDLNLKIIFSTVATPQTTVYAVKPGDSLD